MKINPPVLGNAPVAYSRQYFDMLLGSLRSYFDRLYLTESTGGGTPGGADTQVQFNNAGAFGGSSNLTVDTGTGALTAALDVTVSGATVGVGGDGSADALLDEGNVVLGLDAGQARVGVMTTAGSFVDSAWYRIVTIGTTDFTLVGAASNTVGLVFRANDVGSGTGTAYQMASYNTLIGAMSGAAMELGNSNVYVGYNAGAAVQTGEGSVFIGARVAQLATTADGGVLIGDGVMEDATYAAAGVVIGTRALQRGTSTNGMVVVGRGGVRYGYGVSAVTAVGDGVLGRLGEDIPAGSFIVGRNYWITSVGTTNFVALGAASNTVGENFIATGVGSGTGTASTGATRVTVVGYDAAFDATDGNDITGVGSGVFPVLTTGQDNVALGSGAGSVTTGSNNLELANVSSTAIKIFDVAANSNRIVMGNNNHTNAYIKIAWTVTSDARDKLVYGCVPHGLDFVASLYPVQYQFRTARGENTPTGRLKYGFLAQEIRALEDVGVVVDDEDPDNLKYNESSLVPILVNAIKELKARVEALEGRK